MLGDVLLAGLGLVILLLAGDALVKGAVNLALRVGISALLVSLTVVAFGTSAPELLISVAAVKEGAPGIALGNVIGSNTANILLVLGVPALLTGLATKGSDTRKTYVMMLAASLLFIGLAFAGPLTWWHGLILLAGLSVMLGDAFLAARTSRRTSAAAEAAREAQEIDAEEVEGVEPDMPGWKLGLFLVLGLVGLPLGADILVDAGVRIADRVGVPDTVIGLTLIALGTSLPELATTVMAAYRKQSDVALGNVIGSCMFNLLAIIGIACLVGPIPVDPALLRFDVWVMLAASLLLGPFVFLHWHMGRLWGISLCAAYIAYIYVVVA